MAKGERGNYDPFQPLFTICIDKNALRGGLLDDHLAALRNLVADIQNGVPFVRIDETGMDQRADERRANGIQSEYQRLLRKEFTSAIKLYKTRSTEWAAFRANPGRKKPHILMWSDVTEAEAEFEDDPDGVLKTLMEDRFDHGAIHDQAVREYEQQAAKFASKASPQFQHAGRIERAQSDLDWADNAHRPNRSRGGPKRDFSDMT